MIEKRWLSPFAPPTIYWSKLYQTEGSTTTLSIFLPDGTLLATVEGNGVSTTTSIIHTDRLNSVALTSDKNGTLSELSAYYPYGGHRITDLPSSGANVQRGYIGQYEDGATTLSYLQARYYDGGRGQFLSVDPAHLAVGDSHFENRYGRSLEAHLQNPQQLNSYSYAGNNPLVYSDPSGEIIPAILAVYSMFMIGIDLYEVKTVSTYPNSFTEREREETYVKAGFDIATFGLGFSKAFAPNLVFSGAYDALGFSVDAKGVIDDRKGNPTSQSSNSPTNNPLPQPCIVIPFAPQPGPANSSQTQPLSTKQVQTSSPGSPDLDQKTLQNFSFQLQQIKVQLDTIQLQINARKNQ